MPTREPKLVTELDPEQLQMWRQLSPAILRLKPGDLLIVRHPGPLSEHVSQKIRHVIENGLIRGGHDPAETPVIVLTESIKIEILRKEKSAEEKRSLPFSKPPMFFGTRGPDIPENSDND